MSVTVFCQLRATTVNPQPCQLGPTYISPATQDKYRVVLQLGRKLRKIEQFKTSKFIDKAKK